MTQVKDERYFNWTEGGATSKTLTLDDSDNHDSDLMDVSPYEVWGIWVETIGAASHDGSATVGTILFFDKENNQITALDPTVDPLGVTTASAATNREFTLLQSSNNSTLLIDLPKVISQIKLRLSNSDGGVHTVTCRAKVIGLINN